MSSQYIFARSYGPNDFAQISNYYSDQCNVLSRANRAMTGVGALRVDGRNESGM
jgi:hypothetical protein